MKRIFFVYLDEFGHVGPFISRDHPKHKDCPIFGLGGVIIPADQIRLFSSWFYNDQIRLFSSWFYNLKCNLLGWEIEQSGQPPFQWEKKGSSLYTTKNVLKYRELRQATFRMLNKIRESEGKVFYVGIEKTADPADHKPNNMALAILRECIKRLDEYFDTQDAGFIIFLDERDDDLFREAIVRATQTEMHGASPKRTLLETPTQVESHLYQVMQCADWLCGLIGRVETYKTCPDDYPELDWTAKYFRQRLDVTTVRSGVRKQSNLAGMTSNFVEQE